MSNWHTNTFTNSHRAVNSRSPDVIIIGGGVIGLATARELAGRGMAVTVIERGIPGREATWAAGGMLSPLGETDRPGAFLDVARASFERYPDFVRRVEAESGLDIEYRDTGRLEVAFSDEGARQLRVRYAWLAERDRFSVDLLDGREARELEPALDEVVVAALRIADDHRLNNRRFGRALWVAAARAGVRVRTGAPAAAVLSDSGGSTGVCLADGTVIESGQVVVAAGCWSGRIAGLPRRLPVTPVRGQMLALETVPPLIHRVVAGPGCYSIPRSDGRLVIGSTMERAGFSAETTAGGIATLLSAALEMLTGLDDSRIAEIWAGLRPGTPDGLPILGPDPEVDGVFYATGHFRNGILLAPITAEVLGAIIAGEPSPVNIEPFRADRTFESTVAA